MASRHLKAERRNVSAVPSRAIAIDPLAQARNNIRGGGSLFGFSALRAPE